jgi:hypothetical protein
MALYGGLEGNVCMLLMVVRLPPLPLLLVLLPLLRTFLLTVLSNGSNTASNALSTAPGCAKQSFAKIWWESIMDSEHSAQ